jgi:Flp pilus assembly protein TadD
MILPPLALVVVACVAYHNSLSGPFVFDDIINIRNNLKLRQLWPVWETMWGPLATGVAGRPVVQLSLALNYAVHELSVTGYHVTNLVLHVLTALVLYAVLRRTLRLLPQFGERADLLAFVTTLLWQIHPLLSDSVTYLSGRTEILGGLFMLLTLYCAMRAMREGSRTKPWQIAAVVACALGTGCKEILAAAPFLVLIYDWLFVAGSFRAALRARWPMYAGLVATLALIPLNLYMADFHRSALVGQERMSSWTYLKIQSEVLALYLRLSVWPHPLIIDYHGWPTERSLREVLPSALLIVALLGATTWLLVRRRPAGYAGAWFFLILAPTSSLLPLPTEIATERRMYLPLMGIVALVVLGGYRLVQWSRARWPGAAGALPYVAGVVVLAVATTEAARTIARNNDFKDVAVLWQDVIRHRPFNARAYDNLGFEYVGRGEREKAKAAFQRAAQLDPIDQTALNNLAALHIMDGNDDEAVRFLEAAIRVKPDYASPYLNLSTIQAQRGQFADAERSLRESIRLESTRVDNRVGLVRVLVAQGRVEEAEREARAALQLGPSVTVVRDALALVLARGGRVREAIAEWDAIVAAGGGDADSTWHLAWYLASAEDVSLRNPKRAVAAARSAATETKAAEVGPLDAMALALAADGRFDQAVTVAQAALDIAKPRRYFVAGALERRLASYRQQRLPAREDLVLLP